MTGYWADVTEKVFHDLKVMDVNFVASETFQLLDAMSSVEIGDARMDVAVSCANCLTKETAKETGMLEILNSETRQRLFCEILLGHILNWMNDSCYFSQSVWQCVPAHFDPSELPVSLATKFMLNVIHFLSPIARDRIRMVASDEEFCPGLTGQREDIAEIPDGDDLAVSLARFIEDPTVVSLVKLEETFVSWQDGAVEYSAEDLKTVLSLFDVSISRSAWPNGPPRRLRVVNDPKVVMEKFASILAGFRFVFENIPSASNFVSSLARFNFKYGDCLVVRAVANDVFSRSINFQEIFTQQLPPSGITKAENFAEYANEGGIMLEIVARQFMKSPSRLNRNIKKMVPRLSQLIHAGHFIDSKFSRNLQVLTSWASVLSCSLLEYQLKLGFDLELYDDTELGMIYWLLDYFVNMRLQMTSPGDNKLDLAVSTLEKHLFMAMFKVLTVFEKIGVLKSSETLVASKQHRFEMRAKAFAKASDIFSIDYSHFKQSSDLRSEDAPTILSSAVDMMSQVTTVINNLPDSVEGKAALKRVAIANQLVVKQVIGNMSSKVQISRKYHPRIVTLELSK